MDEPAISVSLTIYQLIMLVGVVIVAFWALHLTIVNIKIKNLREYTTEKLKQVDDAITPLTRLISSLEKQLSGLDKKLAVYMATKGRESDE